jgi:hypothetical protein
VCVKDDPVEPFLEVGQGTVIQWSGWAIIGDGAEQALVAQLQANSGTPGVAMT